MLRVTDPEALDVIARAGGAFGALVLGAVQADDNESASRHPAYRSLVSVIARDVQQLAARDPLAGVTVRGHAHRLFDVRWLSARSARFELVAAVNRLDRRPFAPSGCGETRLVYRLSYRQHEGEAQIASRLPMTLAVELRADPRQAGESCAGVAQSWHAPAALTGRALAAHLTAAGGPLAKAALARARIVQVVSNLQTVRWPSAVKPDLGGHAEYVLRAFSWDARAERYRPRKLENTPDLARLAHDAALKRELESFLRAPERLHEIDQGTVRIPERFLAEAAVSVTPRGLARRSNRPFRVLFSPRLFASLDLTSARFARSPEAFLRRLDDLTCNGCHQSRSIAGFHLLGEDPAATAAGNALLTGSSPHTLSDESRRRAYVSALARGEAVDDGRPFAERAESGDDGYGAHCGLGDVGFSRWTCAEGLRCDPYEASADEQTVGVCLPARAQTGDPCEPARVRPNPNARREGSATAPRRACEGICEQTRVGFPGGMCASSCAALPGEASCGGIAILTPFNGCLARGRPFAECVRDHVRPAGLRRCSEQAPCRDDYVCARGSGAAGVCLPPYFVFQMRVDGHPEPR